MYLGIDLGTSELKAIIVDADRQVTLASAGVKLDISRPRSLWSEQSPEAWVEALHAVLDALRRQSPDALAAVRGIGISGQMHGAVLLDAAGEVLRPAILWNDTRSFAECAEIEARVPEARAITGNLMMPGFTAPKLAWLRRHEPDVFAAVATVMLPKDYLVLHLTGERVTDRSDAAGTGWLDVGRRDWSDRLLEATGLDRERMPRLLEGRDPAGGLRGELCRRWGIGGPVVVAAGAADNAATAIGIGAIGDGQALVSLGSSGVILAATDAFSPNPGQAVHAFCHAVPGRWYQMTVTLSATTSLGWAARLCGQASDASFAALAEQVDAASAPIFLPYLNGERTPHNDAAAQGMFFGLTSRTDTAALAYSVLEGVAFSLADGHAALQQAGTRIERAAVLGGGANSRFWVGLVAAACGFALERPVGGDRGGAFGAARLARLAATGEAVEAVCLPVPADSVVPCDAGLRERLMPRYERYKRLYRNNRDEFRSDATTR